MHEPLYSLSLAPLGGGMFVRSIGQADVGGEAGWSDRLPLGSPWSDLFHKSRSPDGRELIRQLVGTAYACAALNSDLLATTRLRLFVRTRPEEKNPRRSLGLSPLSGKTLARLRQTPSVSHFVAGEVNVEEVTDHPLLALLRLPNPLPGQPGMSGYDLRWMTQMYLESVGRAYWLIERDGLGVPRQLWLLRSHLVREIPDATGKQIIAAYEYGGAAGQRYQPQDIVKFHFPDPNNPYLNGYSPLAAAIEKIRISRKEDAHVNALLDNMGRPDAVWSPRGDSEGGGIGPSEAARIRGAFRAAYAMAGRGGVLVSEVPGTLSPLQWAPQDIVELDRAAANKTDICNTFGVPDAKLQRNAANFAAAKTADYAHAKDAGIPRCMRSEETLNARLVPLFDPTGRLFVAYDSPVRDDEVFALEQTRTAAETGAITRNEIRASVGLDPVPWGDTPLMPKDMTPTDTAGRPLGP